MSEQKPSMTLSKAAQEEIRALSHSEALRNDLAAVAATKHNPFIKAGIVDADAYIAFVTAFNEFINHEPKPFVPMIERDMRL
jgi:hypothetical protein